MRSMRGAQRHVDASRRRRPRARRRRAPRRSSSPSITSCSTGSAAVCPSETTSLPLSSSERKRISSISAPASSTSTRAWSISAVDVGAGQVGRVEQREDPRERRPQLVRDGGGEAGAKLVEAAVCGVHVRDILAARRVVLVTIHQIVTIPTPGTYRAAFYARAVAKILIVEDDNVIADGMARHLVAAGFDPVVVGRGELGLARLRFENPDVCVLDLMLPELDGWKLIETARAEGIGTPIVVVSARGTEHDRVHALEIGADDYLVKPFSMRELVARVGAAARRGVRPAEERRGDPIEIEELRIDPREVQAFVDGRSAELTPTEFKLLYTLALDRGRVVTRDELLQKVWGRRETHRDRTVDVFVRRLRQKIDRIASRHSFIQTRFGVGYKLEPSRSSQGRSDRCAAGGVGASPAAAVWCHRTIFPCSTWNTAAAFRPGVAAVAGALGQLEDDEHLVLAPCVDDAGDAAAARQRGVPRERVLACVRRTSSPPWTISRRRREEPRGSLVVGAVQRGAPRACDRPPAKRAACPPQAASTCEDARIAAALSSG